MASVLDHLDLGAFADRRLDSLSGGERQRAVLARALAQQAPVLLLDEPTTGLDVGHQQQVLELVDPLRDDLDLTVVSAMHDLTLAGQFADQLVLLDGGRVAAAGPAGAVLTEEVIARHYHASVRVLEDPGRRDRGVSRSARGGPAGGVGNPRGPPSPRWVDRRGRWQGELPSPPVDPPARPARRRAPSLVLVNTGDGKGKSTAAFGVVLRAVARGWKVCVIQFLKSGRWRTGEEELGRRLGVDWNPLGDGFTWDSEDLEASEAKAAAAWAAARRVLASGDYQLVVLDEVTYPMNWGWIDTAEVVAAIRDRPPQVNVVATGRDAPAELVEVADTVTEMRKVRHAYDSGVVARRGIDY